MKNRKDMMIQLSKEAFRLHDDIVRGTLTGGIEPPRIILSTEEREDSAVVVRWEELWIGGLSDRIYHCTNTGPHEDIFQLTEDNKLLVNGQLEEFGLDIEPSWVIRYHGKAITEFYEKWNLRNPRLEDCCFANVSDPVIRRVLEICNG